LRRGAGVAGVIVARRRRDAEGLRHQHFLSASPRETKYARRCTAREQIAQTAQRG